MTRTERLRDLALLVQAMEARAWVYDTETIAAAQQILDAAKNVPEGDAFEHMASTLHALAGRVSTPMGLALAGGYFVVGLFLTSPLWWKAGR